MNKPLSQAYYLKEQLGNLDPQINKEEAEKVMLDWIRQAQGKQSSATENGCHHNGTQNRYTCMV